MHKKNYEYQIQRLKHANQKLKNKINEYESYQVIQSLNNGDRIWYLTSNDLTIMFITIIGFIICYVANIHLSSL